MEELSVETVYFRASAHFRPFRIVCGCAPIQGKIAKHTWEENGVYSGKVEKELLLKFIKYQHLFCT
jgi:hypothetical protein